MYCTYHSCRKKSSMDFLGFLICKFALFYLDPSRVLILLVEIFSLKHKTSQILPAITEKFNLVSSRKQLHNPSSFVIQTYSGIIGHIQEFSGIFRTLCKPDIFRTLVQNLKHWHIQNQRHIQKYSEH